jgi:myosin-3
METIKIRRQGYSHRIPFTEFVTRYAFLAFSYEEIVVPTRETARILLLRLNMDGWALGKTKVFLKYYHIETLSRLYQDQLKKIVKVQTFVRRWLAKRAFKRELLFKLAAENGALPMFKRGSPARKRGSDIQSSDERVKAANRQDSPDFSHQAGQAVKKVGNGIQNHHNNNNNNNKDKKKGQSPTKAAILIQKCVRGYLTRKKVKAFHYQVEPQHKIHQKDENHNQCKKQQQFQATRMQLYQGQRSDEKEVSRAGNVPRLVISSNSHSNNSSGNNNNNNNNSKSRIPLPVIT